MCDRSMGDCWGLREALELNERVLDFQGAEFGVFKSTILHFRSRACQSKESGKDTSGRRLEFKSICADDNDVMSR